MASGCQFQLETNLPTTSDNLVLLHYCVPIKVHAIQCVGACNKTLLNQQIIIQEHTNACYLSCEYPAPNSSLMQSLLCTCWKRISLILVSLYRSKNLVFHFTGYGESGVKLHDIGYATNQFIHTSVLTNWSPWLFAVPISTIQVFLPMKMSCVLSDLSQVRLLCYRSAST